MFARGDLVRHKSRPAWGIGKVVRISPAGNLLVRFAGSGEKLLHPHIAPLEKVAAGDLRYLVLRWPVRYRGRTVEMIRVIPVVASDPPASGGITRGG